MRGREVWLIPLANREGMAEEAIQVFLVKGGRVQKEPGIIMHMYLVEWPLKK